MGAKLESLNEGQFDASYRLDQNIGLRLKKTKSEIDKAYEEVIKAKQAFDKLDAKVTTLEDKRSSLILAENVYRGLFDDYLNYGLHSIEEMSISDHELAKLVDMIKKNNINKGIIYNCNRRIRYNIIKGHVPSSTDFFIKKLEDPFLPPFATFPDGNKNISKKNIKNSMDAKIARGIVTTNTNLKAVIARESIFYIFFTKVEGEYQKDIGSLDKSAKSNKDTLNSRLVNLQNSIHKYNTLNREYPIIVPGMVSATGGGMIYASVLSEFQIANANKANIVNSANANVLLREIAQQIMQQLKNTSNALTSMDKSVVLDLRGIVTQDSIKLIDKYRVIKNGRTMADKYGALVSATTKNKLSITGKEINRHIAGLSEMIKLLSEEGSKKLIELQDATFKKNNAAEELAKLIRRYFSAIYSAFGLQE